MSQLSINMSVSGVHQQHQPSQKKSFYETYYVPTTLLVVLSSVLFEVKIFARPKSEILGFISPSKRMLLGLRSRCMTRNRECLCRQRSPSAVPSIIARRLFQSSNDFLSSSVYQLNVSITGNPLTNNKLETVYLEIYRE